MSPRANPATVYLESLKPGKSRESVRYALNGLARLASDGLVVDATEFAWGKLRYREVQALRRDLIAKYKPAGVNLRLSFLRRLLDEAWNLRQIGTEDYRRARALRNVRGDQGLRGRSVGGEEIAGLIGVCRRDPVRLRGARDAALLGMTYGTGARRAEVARLRWPHDLDLERGVVVLDTKGSVRRETELLPRVADLVQGWLEQRGQEGGPLFQAISRKGQLSGRPLSPASIHYLLGKRCTEAGLRHATPHDLRRSFTSALIDSGAELHVVQDILKHADLSTTAKYDVRRGGRRSQALARLRMPF